MIAPEFIVGKLPSERQGIALQLTWFDGVSKQAFELGYRDDQLALLTGLTVIDAPGLRIAGDAVLVFSAGMPEFQIDAEIAIAGLISGRGRTWLASGRIGLELDFA